MSAPKLYTPWDRPEDDYEVNKGESLVETVGYVPANVLIENMIYAGARLDQARTDMYDYGPDQFDQEIEEFPDPTRRPDFDLADAGTLMRATTARLSEQRKLFEIEEQKRLQKEAEEFKEYKMFKEEQAVKEKIKND